IFIPNIYDEEGNLVRQEEPVLCPADSSIIAVSQGPKDKIVKTTTSIEVNDYGLISVDDDGRTTREGVFASGDVVAGAKNVVLAVKFSKQVAKAMERYLQEKAKNRS
ncbi:MAG: FAD-dependent oxidoreductase, partial [Selenomonadaceae bacterium]|nr:FAD-dependent oxidoreductase [Selenomonadaceae bacterium]